MKVYDEMVSRAGEIVLVDMDGVIADFDAAFDAVWRGRYPNRKPSESAWEHQRIVDRYPEEYRADIYEVLTAPGFTRNMPEVEGAVDGVRSMQAAGLEVYICTSPLSNYSNNVPEKFGWVEEHLGSAWTKRLVITKDKTVVRGRYLIDDAPVVRGALDPEWEHIIYGRSYNRHIVNSRRLSWNNWKDVL
jgi:5'-nucleotidase